MWKSDCYDPGADGVERERDIGGGRVLFPRSGGAVRWWEEVWGRDGGEMNGVGNFVVGLGAGEERGGGFERAQAERSRTPTVPMNTHASLKITTGSTPNLRTTTTIAATTEPGAVTAGAGAAAVGAGVMGVAGRLGGMVEGVKGLSIGVSRSDPTERRNRGSLEVEMM